MRQLNSGCVQSQASDTHRKWVKVPLSWYKSFDPRPTHSVLNCLFSNNVVAIPLRSHFADMKSMLLSVCVFAAVIVAARGFSREDPMDAVKEESPNELEAQLKNFEDSDDPKNSSNPHDCDCDGVCDALHYSRLPKPVRNEYSYLSYENYPVLCRDAAAILLPQGEKIQKKYVCRQVFDCCRKCNWLFYLCLKLKGKTYGFCMRGAYKCICNCIEKKSYNELPYNPVS